jgi:hypothetical protein
MKNTYITDQDREDKIVRDEMRVSLYDTSPRLAPANTVVKKVDTRTIEQRFEDYHRQHPEVYRLYVQYARIAREKGYKRIGIGFLTEIIRWQEGIAKTERFAISNDYRSRYARFIMANEIDLCDFFSTRNLTSK